MSQILEFEVIVMDTIPQAVRTRVRLDPQNLLLHRRQPTVGHTCITSLGSQHRIFRLTH